MVDLGLVLVERIFAADFESGSEAVVLDRERFEGGDEALHALKATEQQYVMSVSCLD